MVTGMRFEISLFPLYCGSANKISRKEEKYSFVMLEIVEGEDDDTVILSS